MFERYTEKARRSIFFARYEASLSGSPYIETDHLLLGILRESAGLARQHLKLDPSKLTSRSTKKRSESPVSTSVDLPLDNVAKLALAYAAEEAEQLGHKMIGTEHLLLGVLRADQGAGAKALGEAGAPPLAEVRKSIRESGPEESGRGTFAGGSSAGPTWVKFIEEDTGRELSARLAFEAAPRVGEAVIVTPEEGTPEKFRVLDVIWRFDVRPLGKDLAFRTVEVLLKREEPPR
jgi:ATP-dependent Clp protease ATP-binding subunit ClpC